MKNNYLCSLMVLCLSLCMPFVSLAFENSQEQLDIPEPTQFITEHKASFNGQRLTYTVNAGEKYLTDIDGEPKASIFSFDYVVKSDDKRPVTFVWNGGPGSSSTWLHMGAYGPKRIVVPSDADHPGAGPYEIADAPETILDVTDMVFVDPVGTGFSKALGNTDPKDYWGLNEDASSIAQFIAQWMRDNNRWNSPIFLLGESFGTTRAAAVAKVLLDDHLINVNGIIFVSQALDYQGSSPYFDDNIISYITYVPTMAASAWYHKKVDTSGDFSSFIEQSRQFASDELLPALFKGNTISEQEKTEIINGLHKFTGLSKAYIEKVDMRVHAFRFAKELLRDEGEAIGLLDSRYMKDERDDVAAGPSSDASDAIAPPYKASLMYYMRNDLNINWKRKYFNPSHPDLSSNWRWRTAPDGSAWEPKYVNTAPDLAYVLRSNPDLKVMVASGYYDLITPFFDAEFTLNRHGIAKDKIEYLYYHGGHMMYVHEPARLELLSDTRDFILNQLSEKNN